MESAMESGASKPGVAVGHDDYSLARVPESARYSWVTMAVQRFGMLSSLGSFFMGASLGFGMSFQNAMLAILLGSVLLEFVTIFVGIAGQREGMSTSLLARWSGFGSIGASLLGIVLAVSLVGWFGVQTEIFGAGAGAILKGVPIPILSIIGGLIVTVIVVYGIKWMNWVAYVSVPLFLALVGFAFYRAISSHDVASLLPLPMGQQAMPLATGITFVAGGFIAGAIFTPDMSRFNRTAGDVVKQTIIGVTLGEFFVGVTGVLLAHTVKVASPQEAAGAVITMLSGGTGAIGIAIVCLSVVKVNDWNLYPGSLGLTNAIHGLFGVRVNRVYVALGLGLVGSVVAALGMASHMQEFLGLLGVAFPPIAAIMIADYFIVKSHRAELDHTRQNGFVLPSVSPMIVPAGLVAWGLGGVIAYWMGQNPTFLPAINVPAIVALVITFVVYVILGKLGWAKGYGTAKTPTA